MIYEWNLDTRWVTLEQYVEHMVEGQDKILFIFAVNREMAIASPYMESMP